MLTMITETVGLSIDTCGCPFPPGKTAVDDRLHRVDPRPPRMLGCLALARLILYGIFERYPGLQLVATHLGGGISEVMGRLDYNYELQSGDFYAREDE